ncbi:MAG: hypothetical protein ACK47B_12030 [Armatimonadota bacterium]
MRRLRSICIVAAVAFYPWWIWVLLLAYSYRPPNWTSGPHPWNGGLREIALGVWVVVAVVVTWGFIRGIRKAVERQDRLER